MMRPSRWLPSWLRKNVNRTQPLRNASPSPTKLGCESLEDRTTPASSITIMPGLAGSGSLDAALTGSGGTILVSDGGAAPGTLSTGALAAIPATNNISITAAGAITVNDLASQGGTLALATGAGRVATFTAASGGSITFVNTGNSLTTAGGSLALNASGALTVGQLATTNGNLTLTASTGAVTQSGAANAGAGSVNVSGGANVTVDALTGGTVNLTSTGGTLASATGSTRVTASGQVAASAATGINLRTQTPALTQAVNSTSGNVTVVNTGSLALSGPVSAAGSGNVSVTAPSNGAVLTVGAGVSSGTGNVTLAGADGLTVAAAGTVTTAGGAIGLNADANFGGGGVYSQAAGSSVTSGGGTVTVQGTDAAVAGTLSAGTGRVNVQNSTALLPLTLGSEVANTLSLTDTELDNITAGVVQFGSNTAGVISVTAAITPAGTSTLTLFNNAAITETGSITVANLRVSSAGPVALTGANQVGTLAGVATAGLTFNNQTNPLTVGIVDTIIGLSAPTGGISLTADGLAIQQQVNAGGGGTVALQPFTTASVITIGAGATGFGVSDAELALVTAGVVRIGNAGITGAVTVDGTVTRHGGYNTLSLVTGNTSATAVSQTAPLSVANLAIDADGGGVVLVNPSNDVDTLAIDAAQAVSFRDANAMTVVTVDGVVGVDSGATVALETGAGLTVNDKISAAGIVGLRANGPLTQSAAAGAAVVAPGGLLLTGGGPVTLNNLANSTPTLAANVTNGLAYTNAGTLATGSLTLAGTGSAAGLTTNSTPLSVATVAGNLTVSAAAGIAAGTGAVSLTAGGLDSQFTNNATVSGGTALVTADRIALVAGSSIMVNTNEPDFVTLRPGSLNRPVNIDNAAGDPAGELRLSEAELQTITAGVVRVGRLDNAGALSVVSNVTNPAGWTRLHLLAGGNVAQAGGVLNVTELVAESGGSVGLAGAANTVTTLAGRASTGFSFTNTGSLIVETVDGIAGVTNAATTGSGITLTVNGANNLLSVLSPLSTGGSSVALTADDMAITAGVGAGVGTVLLTPFTTARTVDLGTNTAGTLGLTDAELDRVTAGVLQVGGSTPQLTGNIAVTLPITQFGSGYTNLVLNTDGSITTVGTGSITGNNLTALAGTGIGTLATPLATQVSNLAFDNSNSGPVNVLNIGGLTIANLPGAATSQNGVTGQPVTLATTGGPIRFAVQTKSAGTLTATATETGAAGDDITVNSGVLVYGESDVTLRAGDNVVLLAGSTVQSNNGTVSLTAGFGDTGDNIGALVLNGNILISGGAALSLTALQDITLGTLLNYAGSTVSLTSTKGAIIDGNDPPAGTNNVVAQTLNLSAATGIGSGPGANAPIEVSVSTLTATNTTSGDIRVVNLAGNLTASATNTGGGPVSISALGAGSILTIGLTGVVSNGGAITLTADDMTIGNPVNAGAGANSIVTLNPVSPARPIQLGVNSVGSTLGLTDLELDKITAATALRIGGAVQTGNITVEAPISQGTGYSTLSLQTAGTISQNPGVAVTGSTLNLALRGAAGVNAAVTTNDVVSVAGATTAAGAGFTYFDVNGLTVGVVDGVSGVQTNNGVIDIETFGVGGLAVAPSVAINSTGGNVTLIARGNGQAFNLNTGASVASGGGTLLVQADNMSLNGSAVNAGPGRATLKPFTLTPAVAINLGGPDVPTVPSTLGLTATELGIITASVLQIGDADSGSISVTAAVATPGAQTLRLQTGGGITEVGGGSITANNLVLQAVNAITMTGGNDVTGTLAAAVSTGGQAFTFTDVNSLTVGTADGVSGINTNDAAITVATTNGALTLTGVPVAAKNGPISLTAGGANSTLTSGAAISNLGGNPITLQADRMLISAGSITAGGGGRVTLQATSPGRAIDLGSSSDLASALELSNTEIGTISTTGPLQIGRGVEGAINVSSSISVGAGGAGTLTLFNNGPVTQTGIITAGNLRVSSAGPVTLTSPNNVAGMIAGALTSATAAFTFTNAGNLTIGNVDGVTGITTVNGPITVSTTNGNLTATNNITAGTAPIELTAGGAENLLAVTPLQAFGSSVLLTADRISLAPGVANLINVGTGTIGIVPFTAGRDIVLGTAGDPAGTLNLTDGELDSLFAGLVRIGAGVGTPVTAVAGAITVTNAITQGPGYTTLSLAATKNVVETGAGSLGVENLAVRGATGVNLASTANAVTNLAGTTSGADFTFTNGPSLLVNSVDGLNGITTGGGDVAVTVGLAGGLLGIQNAVIAGNADVVLTADDMDLQAQVSGGTGRVTLAPANNPRVVTLGANAGGTLGLTDAELDRVVAGVLQVGTAANGGNINVAAAITAPPGYSTLALITGGGIADTTVTDQTDITVANLALQAAAGIGDANDLDVAVTNLAAANTTAGNLQVSNAGALTVPAAGVAGVSGVTNTAPGAIALSAAGGALTIANQVLGSGGGAVSLTTSGAGGAITVAATGSVIASGGNGNVVIDASAATSGGSVTINNGPAAADVAAAGTGNITVRANDGLTVGANAVVAAVNGTILFESNAGDAAGTANVTLTAGSKLVTNGDVVLNADPDGNGTGGTIVIGSNVSIQDVGGNDVNSITLVAATDLTLTDLQADTAVSVTSSGGSLRDDGVEGTVVRAPNITLAAARAIGGNAAITVNETLTRTGNYLGAIDFDLTGGTLTVSQTGAGGNVQLRQVGSTFANSTLPAGFSPVGANSQLALFGDAGVTIDTPITLSAVNNINLLVGSAGTTPGSVVIGAAVTNSGSTAPSAFVTADGSVNVNAAVTSGGGVNLTAAGNDVGDGVFIAANVTASGSAATVVADANRDVILSSPTAVVATTAANGGAISLTAARPLPGSPTGNLGVVTMANGSTVTTAANNSPITINAGQTAGAGGDVTLSAVTAGTGPVNVRAFTGAIADGNGPGLTNVAGGAINLQAAGAAGINLDVFTAAPTTAGLTAATTDDPITIRGQANTQLQITNVNAGAADVTLIANNGSLTNRAANDLSADVTGNTVTLTATGTGTIGQPGPAFFEVDAKFLNATTVNQNLWVADVAGGVGINTVNAGSATAILQSANGAMVSATVDGLPDVAAGAVVLNGAAVGGSFGTSAASPLEIAAGTLSANLLGAGSVSVRDTGGGLVVNLAQTLNGNVNLEAAGPAANLTLTQVVAGGGGTATARATGAVTGTAGGPADVTAGAFAVLGATNVGTLGAPLETAVGQLASTVGTGGVFVSQLGAVDVTSVAGVNGITATGGRVAVTAAGGTLSVSQNVTTPAEVTLAATLGAGVVVNGPAAVSSTGAGVTITADGGLTVGAGASVTAAGPVSATVGAGGTSTSTIAGTFAGGNPSVVGNGGADSLTIDFGAGASLPAGLTFVSGGGADVLTVTDASGPAANHVYDIDPTQIVRDGATGAPIAFAGTAALVVTGGPSDDVFNVTPGALTAVTVNGGLPVPPAAPGDALNVDLTGVDAVLSVTNTPTGVQGNYSFLGGVQPVAFTEIETLGAVPFSLAVTNTNGQATSVPGTTVTYTATVTNTGTLGVSGVNFTNDFTSALTNVSWSATFSPGSSGNAFGTGNINEILTVAGGGTVTYTITGTIDPSATGTLVSTAAVNTAGLNDNNAADDTAVDTDTLTPVADVAVTVSSGISNVTAGGTVTYTIVVSNAGPSTAAGVALADSFPAGIAAATFSSTANGGATGNTSGTGNIADTLTLPPGATVTYTAVATIADNAGGTLANTVTATVPGGTTDPVPANNTATDTIQIVATSADLAVTIAANSGTVGTNLTYTISVTNNGPGQADGVVVTDFLPANVTLVSAVPSQGTVGVISGGTAISAALGSLASGATATVVVTFTTNRAGARTTNAAVTSTTPDPVSGNNTATASLTVSPFPGIIVVGAGPGGSPLVQVFDAASGRLIRSFFAFDAAATGGVSVAQGDVNGDGVPEIIAGAGDGGSPLINVFDLRTGGLIKTFFGFDPSFRGGVHVAAGDTNGDGKADIIAGAGNTGAPQVVVFDGVNGTVLRSFFAYDPGFRGGVQVASGDVNNDGFADIVTGAGVGGAPHATVFDGRTGVLLQSFFAYDQSFRGGVQVAAADVNGDGITDVIAGAGFGGSPQVTVFDGNTARVLPFFAFDDSARGGVNVSTADVDGNGTADIIAATGPGSPPMIRAFSGVNFAVLDSFSALDPTFLGGVFVG